MKLIETFPISLSLVSVLMILAVRKFHVIGNKDKLELLE